MSELTLLTVHCRFNGCAPSIVTRIVMAAVDQLAAEVDVDIVLLDALDYPLGEIFDSLDSHGIERVDASIVDGRLSLVIWLETRTDDVLASLDEFGDFSDIVDSFFDVAATTDPPRVELTGMLV